VAVLLGQKIPVIQRSLVHHALLNAPRGAMSARFEILVPRNALMNKPGDRLILYYPATGFAAEN